MTRNRIFYYAGLFLGIELLLFALLFLGKEHAEKQYISNVVAHHQGEYEAQLTCFGRMARFAAREIFGRPEVVALIARAAQASGQERDQIRDKLYTMLSPSYANLGQEFFRQIHYHFADGTSFLRLHKPESFGDNLLAFRPSVLLANEKRHVVEGFEVGRDYHAFRHVFPLSKDGKHLGTVEISKPFYVLSKALRQVYPEEYSLIVNKSLLLQRLTAQGLDNYTDTNLADDYLQEKADINSNPDSKIYAGHLKQSLIVRINNAIGKKIRDRLVEGKPFAQSLILDGTDYLVTFLPVREVNGQHAGYLVSYGSEAPMAFIRYGYQLAHLLSTILLVLLFVLHLKTTKKIAGQLSFQRQLLEALPIPVCLKDLRGFFTSSNEAFAALCRLPRESIIGQRSVTIFEAETAGQQQRLDELVFSTREKQQEEMRLAYPDGNRRDLLVVKAPFFDDQGRVVGIIGSAIDITEQKQSTANAKKSYAELDQIFNTAANGMWVIDKQGTVLRANNTFYALTGLNEQEVIGRKCHEVFPGEACHTERCPLSATLSSLQRMEVEMSKVLLSGRRIEVAVTSHPHYGIDGEFLGIIEDFKDITSYKKLEQHLREITITDELTGLFNRRGFFTLGENQRGNGLRAGNDMFLIFADLDNMKLINDTLGHEAGDLALVAVTGILRGTFRHADVLARFGGDEFAVFMSCNEGTDSEQAILERLEKSIAQENLEGKYPFSISVSFGVAKLRGEESLEQLMIRADGLMYDSKLAKKARGKSGVKQKNN